MDTFLRPVAGVSAVSLPLPRPLLTSTVYEDLVNPYRYLDYPYYDRYDPYYSRYSPYYGRYSPYYSRYYPNYYPYRYYEPLASPSKTVTRTYTPERPGRTVETTTYHSPLGNRTVTRYL